MLQFAGSVLPIAKGLGHGGRWMSLAQALHSVKGMEALLWVVMTGIFALCAWIWVSQFGRQFPRGRRPVSRTGATAAVSEAKRMRAPARPMRVPYRCKAAPWHVGG